MKGCGTVDILTPIRWLLGRWRSVSASIQHPEFHNVDIRGNLNIIDNGLAPTFIYTSIKTHGINNSILQYSTGFISLKGNVPLVYLYYVGKQGIMCTEKGTFEGRSLHLVSTYIYEVPLKDQKLNVTRYERFFKLKGTKLYYRLLYETLEKPLEEIASITYEKSICDDE